ncbi:MAG: hypothetical protein NUV65_00765 [Candidatus Roizmanbacteria bacterium]|nr:hypothetical protein [Candidatus Roizmanbacteria bacterium]
MWSAERDTEVTTSFGSIRVFNATGSDLNLGLIRDIAESCRPDYPLKKASELRIFSDMGVVQGGTHGWQLSSDPASGRGLTITNDYQSVSVIPLGWTSLVKTYESAYGGVPPLNGLSSQTYATLNIAHELCGHNIPRSGDISNETPDPEKTAQIYERVLYTQLLGRTLIK